MLPPTAAFLKTLRTFALCSCWHSSHVPREVATSGGSREKPSEDECRRVMDVGTPSTGLRINQVAGAPGLS
ncbi:hypothetical protein L596_007508 [Steinernema carpocapsae]|uniref:Uncharacterized protein n=1 Tax=Steinernema carpocapsae TaxID=34508 RepID=A0A4U5P9X2_STECR|nr:hypothetical protein L596_007508 [Steinernema carpocapsae]